MRHAIIAFLIFAFGCSKGNEEKASISGTYAIADMAKPMVFAIYRFHNERGLWPRDLAEITEYLDGEQLRGWIYEP